MMNHVFDRVENIVEMEESASYQYLPVFYPFPTFSKGIFFKIVKSRDFVVKGLSQTVFKGQVKFKNYGKEVEVISILHSPRR